MNINRLKSCNDCSIEDKIHLHPGAYAEIGSICRHIGDRTYTTDDAELVITIACDTSFVGVREIFTPLMKTNPRAARAFHAEHTALYRTADGIHFIAGKGYGRWRKLGFECSFKIGAGIRLISSADASELISNPAAPIAMDCRVGQVEASNC